MTTKSAINFRTTYIMIGAAAALLAGLAIYVWVTDETKPNPQGFLLESFYNIGAKPDQITGIEIEKGGEKLVFARQQDGRWNLEQPIKARADSDLVDNLVHQVLTARREEKGVDIVDNLGVHGLDNPSVKLTVRRGDRTATLSLGKVSLGGDQASIYVLTSDQPKKVQATLKKRLPALFKEKGPSDGDTASMVRDLDEFRSRKLLGELLQPEAAPTTVNGIRLTVGKKVLYLSRNNPEKVWRFESPAGYGDVETLKPDDKSFNPARFQYLGYLLNTILSIEVANAKDFLEGTPDLLTLGLDPTDPDVLRIDLERTDAIGTETLWLSRKNLKAKGDKVNVRYGEEDVVAQVDGQRIGTLWNLVQDPTDLRDLTLVKLRPQRVDAIDVIQGGKKAFELRRLDNRWKIFEGDRVSDADPAAIESILTLATQPRAVRGFPVPGSKDDALGFDMPVAELKIWEDGITDGKKEDPNARPTVRETPTTRILFGKTDVGDVVFVRRFLGANSADAKMPIALLNDVLRERIKYVNVVMKPFQVESVTKVIIPRGRDNYEIERTEGGKWVIATPESKKGKYANPEKIHALLAALIELHSQRLSPVAENPTKAQLEALGLAPDTPEKPIAKVSLRIQGEMTDRVWLFGNPVAKRDTVYAKSNLSDYVIEISKQIPEIANTGDLVDPHLYQIAAHEVEGMKLRGWSDLSPKATPVEISLIRKSGGVWEAPKKDAVVSSDKVEALLTAILNPQAETTVAEKGKPVEHQGLDVNKGALEITIDHGSGKKIVLTIGNLVTKESKLLYAMFNGDIVTLKADALLLDVKAKPAALR